jgi:hypothetical protein
VGERAGLGPKAIAAPAASAATSGPRNIPAFAVVENVTPCVDGGRFPAKRVVGDTVEVNASCFAHGHELVACVVRYRGPGGPWTETPMTSLGNDRWSGAFEVDRTGRWEYEVICWVDHLTHWREEFVRRVEPDDIRLNALMGADLIARCDFPEEECKDLAALATILRTETDIDRLRSAADDDNLFAMARRHEPRDGLARSAVYAVQVDRVRARFSTWYEIFPRSCSSVPGKHGTFADLDERLDEIAAMGFDVLYLPPIHPIGRDKRKGKNNAVVAAEGDVGSPWAIGAAEGGHTEILPELGTAADLRHLVMATRARHGARPGHRLPVLARAPVGEGAPRVVRQAPRRQHPVRREPAQEVPGHLPARLRHARLEGALGGAARRLPALVQGRHPGLPGGQPAHQRGAALQRHRDGRLAPEEHLDADGAPHPEAHAALDEPEEGQLDGHRVEQHGPRHQQGLLEAAAADAAQALAPQEPWRRGWRRAFVRHGLRPLPAVRRGGPRGRDSRSPTP